ncbi:MAG: hypothetical protein KAW12_29765 [Candidatus Aminicenantes bacterium]|nr:hypothetical protein [Candidatus Aminicenantes bacterium]
MKKGRLMVGISGILLIIAVVFVYLSFYFFPTVEDINKYRREAKDIKARLADFGQVERNFSFPDEKEEDYFEKAGKEFKNKIPKIRGKGDLARLLDPVSGYLRELAGADGIAALVIEPGSEEAGKEAAGFLKYRVMLLRFTGELGKGLNFINHIPWGKYYIGVDKITLSGSGELPGFGVKLRVYYFATGGASAQTDAARDTAKTGEGGLEIDFDSEILLERVYYNVPERYIKRELPTAPLAPRTQGQRVSAFDFK